MGKRVSKLLIGAFFIVIIHINYIWFSADALHDHPYIKELVSAEDLQLLEKEEFTYRIDIQNILDFNKKMITFHFRSSDFYGSSFSVMELIGGKLPRTLFLYFPVLILGVGLTFIQVKKQFSHLIFIVPVHVLFFLNIVLSPGGNWLLTPLMFPVTFAALVFTRGKNLYKGYLFFLLSYSLFYAEHIFSWKGLYSLWKFALIKQDYSVQMGVEYVHFLLSLLWAVIITIGYWFNEPWERRDASQQSAGSV